MAQPAKSPALALLKVSVVIMGLLILLGLGAVVYGVINKTNTAFKGAEGIDLAKAATLKLDLPAATQVKAMTASEKTVALHLSIPGQGEWVYVIPLSADGRVLKIAIGGGETK
ncbi:MAG: hypothetical protein KIT16_16150 [Rhodospirillaceae bacterium]|nr:hypothetical protein [Rhodospirillaceae bacterium]